jgi:hypothetical protein
MIATCVGHTEPIASPLISADDWCKALAAAVDGLEQP